LENAGHNLEALVDRNVCIFRDMEFAGCCISRRFNPEAELVEILGIISPTKLPCRQGRTGLAY
jgi:hypothetical protein